MTARCRLFLLLPFFAVLIAASALVSRPFLKTPNSPRRLEP